MDFIIVTAMQLLDDTGLGRIIFPMSYWIVVLGRFHLETHAQLVAGGQREAGGLWRFTKVACTQPACGIEQLHRRQIARWEGSTGCRQRLMWQKSTQKHPR